MRCIAMVVLFLSTAFAAEARKGVQPASTRAPFYLLVDHLSPVLYEGEPMTACFRVENTTDKEAKVELCATVFGKDGKKSDEDRRKLVVEAKGQLSCRFDLTMESAGSVGFKMTTPQGTVPGPKVRAVRDRDAWPQAGAVAGRLTDRTSGDVIVPIVARREHKEERSFSSLRWLVTEDGTGKARPQNAFLFLPAEWLGKKFERAAECVPEKLLAAKAWKSYGPCPLKGVPPVLLAVSECARKLPQPAPGRVVVWMPMGDLQTSVDPRLYRISVEVLLSRFEAAGVKDVVIAAPMLYGSPEALNRMLGEAIKKALDGRPGRMLDAEPFLEDAFWRLDAGTPGVFGRTPNADGRKKIRQALADLIP